MIIFKSILQSDDKNRVEKMYNYMKYNICLTEQMLLYEKNDLLYEIKSDIH